MATMDAEGMDVSAQNDVVLESVLGITSRYQKFYDYSRCMRGVAVALSPEQVWYLHSIPTYSPNLISIFNCNIFNTFERAFIRMCGDG